MDAPEVITHTTAETTWLTVREFATKQEKRPVTIYKWISEGFVVELGFRINRDATGHWKIGIPQDHASFHDLREA
jgi:hypothetical protein